MKTVVIYSFWNFSFILHSSDISPFSQRLPLLSEQAQAVTWHPVVKSYSRVPTKRWKWNSMTFPWLSMTKLVIFHDHFRSQDSCNFSREIHIWTILETTISVTMIWMQIRENLWFSMTISAVGILANFHEKFTTG